MIAAGSLIAAGLILSGWLYWLTNRVQLLLDHADRQQDVIDRQLATVPGKSAPPTDGAGEKPRRWWQALEALTVPDDEPPRPSPRPRAEPIAAVVDADPELLLDQPLRRRHAAPTRRKP